MVLNREGLDLTFATRQLQERYYELHGCGKGVYGHGTWKKRIIV